MDACTLQTSRVAFLLPTLLPTLQKHRSWNTLGNAVLADPSLQTNIKTQMQSVTSSTQKYCLYLEAVTSVCEHAGQTPVTAISVGDQRQCQQKHPCVECPMCVIPNCSGVLVLANSHAALCTNSKLLSFLHREQGIHANSRPTIGIWD